MSVFSSFPVIQTERLTLRALRLSDRAAIFRMYSDATIAYLTRLTNAQLWAMPSALSWK